jgi:Arc/MetJ family transcription regulator
MRTNIDIDDDLMAKAMVASKANSKKAVVEEALRLFVQIKGQGAIRDLWGTVTWCGPNDDWFAPDPLDPKQAKEIEDQTDTHASVTGPPSVRVEGCADEEVVAARGSR